MAPSQTLQGEIAFSGIGIHSGQTVRMLLRPSDSGEVLFRRTGLANIQMRLEPARIEAQNCTSLLGENFSVRTMEHLLASLFSLGINSLEVELNSDEIPIMDGSALPFVEGIDKAGTRRLSGHVASIQILRPVILEEDGCSVSASPSIRGEGMELGYTIEFSHPAIGNQSLSLTMGREVFIRDIAPARTFGFLKDVEKLWTQGLALGGSLDNTVVLDENRVVNGPLRFPDEFVRHKILDFVGDLSLLGHPLIGRFIAHKAGHRLHLKLVNFLLDHREYWTLV